MVFIDNRRFLTPRSSFYYPVAPPIGDPDKGVLVQVCINRAWIPYILGALEQLVNPYTWKAVDGAQLKLTEQRANQLLYMFQTAKLCNAPTPPISGGGGGESEDFLIRQNPDNPCLLETSANGIDWCLLADFSLCIPGIGQPGGEQHQPAPGGGEVCYKGTLMADQQWLVPTVVTTGDTITLSKVTGAASSDGIVWICPNGQNYFAGICNGDKIYGMSDEVLTATHMAVLVNISGTFYDLSDPVVVPSGVLFAPIQLQMNSASLGGNQGSYEIEVCVQNNQAATWSHIVQFPLTAGGFEPGPTPTDPLAVYVAGTGWRQNNTRSSDGSTTPRYTVDDFVYTFDSPTTLTEVIWTYNETLGINPEGSTLGNASIALTSGSPVTLASNAGANGSAQTLAWSGTQAATGLKFHGVSSDGGNAGTGTGLQVVYQLKVSGRGFDPFLAF